jgi:hypothetical protein
MGECRDGLRAEQGCGADWRRRSVRSMGCAGSQEGPQVLVLGRENGEAGARNTQVCPHITGQGRESSRTSSTHFRVFSNVFLLVMS